MDDYSGLVECQREFFIRGGTLDLEYRADLLKKLKSVVEKNEDAILDALRLDLGKHRFEAYVSEISHFYTEIDYAVSKIRVFFKPRRRLTPFVSFPASSFTYRQPYGTVLILSSWNYPFDLAMVPLVYAVACGNTVVLKPSEYAENTSRVLARMVESVFQKEHVAVIEGDAEVAKNLLECRWDYIFYTGNPVVGRYVMERASRYLTPVTLELGGKSPAIVWGKRNMDLAVKRIVWGKCFNAGQTCIAPDYAVVEKGRLGEFVERFSRWVNHFYGDDPKFSPDYARIVSERHFDRLNILLELEKDRVLFGGDRCRDELYIAPTIIRADWDSPCMQEEVFGPILPVVEVESIADAVREIAKGPSPLAVYLFTDDNLLKDTLIKKVPSGAVVINDCLVHFISKWLPFGGVGESGIGRYHGRWSFETFSYEKAVVKRPDILDLPVRYPPYRKWKFSFIRRLGWFITRYGI